VETEKEGEWSVKKRKRVERRREKAADKECASYECRSQRPVLAFIAPHISHIAPRLRPLVASRCQQLRGAPSARHSRYMHCRDDTHELCRSPEHLASEERFHGAAIRSQSPFER